MIQNKDDPKNENDLKMKTTSNMKMTPKNKENLKDEDPKNEEDPKEGDDPESWEGGTVPPLGWGVDKDKALALLMSYNNTMAIQQCNGVH